MHPFFVFLIFISDCVGSPLLHGLFSSCDKWGFALVVVRRLLIAVASLVVEHGLWGVRASFVAHGLSSCSSWSLEHRLN